MFKRLRHKDSSKVTFYHDGVPVNAFDGETVAAALLCAGIPFKSGTGGAPYCQMGSCFGCLVNIGDQTVQACLIDVVEGMNVSTAPTNGNSADD